MSMVGELSYFLGLHIRQMNEGIFINQVKYVKDLLKKYDLEGCDNLPYFMHNKSKSCIIFNIICVKSHEIMRKK